MAEFGELVGAPERRGRRRQRGWIVVAAASLGASLFIAACDGNESSGPATLMNGAPVSKPPVDLEGIEGRAVMTSVTTEHLAEIEFGSAVAACTEQAGRDHLMEPIVIRVGVSGESVTFRNKSENGLYGCDDSPGPREGQRKECGVAFGQLLEGQLQDPRLNVGACTTRDGAPLGFAWVEPVQSARYVTVEHHGYFEVYETAGGLPIRVTSDDVEIERSSAAFRVTEHGAGGELIRRYRLEARVAG